MTINSTKNFAKSNCTVQQYPEIMLYHIHCHRTLKRGFGAECIVFGLLERTVAGKFAGKVLGKFQYDLKSDFSIIEKGN